MRKLMLVSLLTVLLCAFSSCSDGTDESNIQSSESVADSVSTSAVTDTATEQVTAEQTTESATTTESVQTTAVTSATTVPDIPVTAVTENPEPVDVSEGAVFDTPVEEQSEQELIAVGLALFKSACQTEWDYTVGSPYELDTSITAQNKYGWDCYLVITDGVNSLADVRADYHKIFSENYADNLDETFTEANGRVYCLNGARGADIFYEKSVITAINSRSESEISFTVQNSYSGDDFGGEAHAESDEFVISADSDGKWRVSVFRMPY